jgi:hypothetical protein
VPAIVELLLADEAQIRFVDERRGVERLARLLTSKVRRGEPAQFIVDQRKQLRRGVRIAVPEGVQNAGHFIHRRYRFVFAEPAPEYTACADAMPRKMIGPSIR